MSHFSILLLANLLLRSLISQELTKSFGILKSNIVPIPTLLFTEISPPCILTKDLTKDNAIGIKYIFKNNQSNIKYVRVGFIGVENYNNDANLLAYYYSRYYAI